MANWFHRFLNPHCPDCALERQDKSHCNTCEVLREMVSRLESENHELRDRLFDKQQPIPERTTAPTAVTRPNKPVAWAIKRQMLEQESKVQARLLSKLPQPDKIDVKDLEEEMDIVSAEREGQKGVGPTNR